MSSTASRGAPARTHVPELDGVRGVAIAMVMALHFVNNLIEPGNVVERAAVKLSSYGLWGVDLFFVLSGFLITGILADSKGQPGYFRNFFAKRTLRIFPLYYGVLVVLTLLVPALAAGAMNQELLDLQRVRTWLWLYLTNVYLGPETDFTIPYLSHFWSLAIEEHFYLVWPFVIWSLTSRAAMRACLGLSVAALALRIGYSATAPTQLYADVLTPCRIDALCIGAWFALASRTNIRVEPRQALRLAWLAAGVVLALSAWHVVEQRSDAVVLPLRTSMLSVFFGAMIYGVTHSDGLAWIKAGLRVDALRHLGRYSYGLYVFHGIVAYAMDTGHAHAYFSTLSPLPLVGSAMMVTVGVGVSYAVAMASYHWFELPFLSLKKRFGGPTVAS